jgi:hypothetical protein
LPLLTLSILFFIAIFEIIVSLLLMCSLLLYVKRIIGYNAAYGRSSFFLGAVFIGSNVLAGSFNFYIGSLTAAQLLEFK